MMNGLEVKEDEFRNLNTDMKLLVMFQNLAEIRNRGPCQIDKCDTRFKKLERHKWWVLGGVAGVGAAFSFLKFWRS
jgi:hypothetical protein